MAWENFKWKSETPHNWIKRNAFVICLLRRKGGHNSSFPCIYLVSDLPNLDLKHSLCYSATNAGMANSLPTAFQALSFLSPILKSGQALSHSFVTVSMKSSALMWDSQPLIYFHLLVFIVKMGLLIPPIVLGQVLCRVKLRMKQIAHSRCVSFLKHSFHIASQGRLAERSSSA